ncbi:hypothetical protein ACIBO5_07700 [Nonomuraea angiospora]|uniref:hypothetical protein n=1 Tax=Nonomuraea angiospora TaxID=46172 RepID=UPI0029BCC9E2|nr:hypothetical protein [Nonomuraea angiospora]MDX3103171.1 hypothetical protein [Nonomuraea angiospora]
MFRRVLSIMLPVVVVTASQAVASAPASAGAYGCSGSQVGSWAVPLRDLVTGGTYYRSDIKLFYDASTGWNCAVLAKRPGQARYGERTPMAIHLWNSRLTDDNVKNNKDSDSGRFKYYAGPVRVYGKNLCMYINALHGDHTGPEAGYNGQRQVLGVACG